MTFLYLNSNKMGEGDPELGKILLKLYLKNLAESEFLIDVIGCVNSGVLLTTSGSKVINSLKIMEKKGTRIATCGTCLDHHGLREDLIIGEIGNMKDTVSIMMSAEKIIRPC